MQNLYAANYKKSYQRFKEDLKNGNMYMLMGLGKDFLYGK